MFEVAINAATATPSGVASLGAAYTEGTPSLMTDAQSNEHRQLGSFTRSDGSNAALQDVWFIDCIAGKMFRTALNDSAGALAA